MPALDISRLSNGVTLPKEVSAEVIGKLSYASAVMAASRQVPVAGAGVAVPVVTGHASAAWAGETDEIAVSKNTFATKDLTPYKLGVIVPVSKELIRDMDVLYQTIVEELPAALAAKFDATVAGTVAPGSNFDVLGSATATEIDYTKFGAGLAQVIKDLGASDAEVSDWLASSGFYAELITAADTNGRPLYPAGFDGNLGAVYGGNVRKAKLGTAIGLAGDFAGKSVYGIVDGIEISVSDQATIKDGATSVNLWQRDMVAIKATAHIGFRVADANAFRMITKKAA